MAVWMAGESFASRKVTAAGHVFHEGDDLIFHILIDGIGDLRIVADEVDVADGRFDVLADEVREGGAFAFGLIHGLVVLVVKIDEVAD